MEKQKTKPSTKTTGKTKNITLFLTCLFLGWLGLDKLYKGGRTAWKLALTKFLLMFVGVGEIWNIYDIICAAMGKYKLNPLKK